MEMDTGTEPELPEVRESVEDDQDTDGTAPSPPEDSHTSAVQLEAEESRKENSEPTVQGFRKSTRVSHPPIRYGV